MPRGGKREGAGKKPLLEYDDRQMIGAACESVWREQAENKYRSAVSDELSTHELEGLAATIQSVPVSSRPELVRLFKLPYHLRQAEFDAFVEAMPEDQADKWIEWFEDLKARNDTLARIGQIPQTQRTAPQGLRDAVIEHVAMKATDGFGIEIKPSLVSTCWDEFRSLQNEVRRDVFGRDDDDV